jgi:multisubunit Na+/H+ antiporter MnhB subunit
MDFAGLSFPVAMGLIMIFFSREKVYDERIAYLKFRSLAAAVPLGALVAMLINYVQNYEGYSIETDSWYSISAFEYLSITLIIAIGWFQYLRVKE